MRVLGASRLWNGVWDDLAVINATCYCDGYWPVPRGGRSGTCWVVNYLLQVRDAAFDIARCGFLFLPSLGKK